MFERGIEIGIGRDAIYESISVEVDPAPEIDVEIKVSGEDGITPHIGANGNWWIGDEDTGVNASGGIAFTTDETLILDPDTNILSVNRANEVEADNTLPITSAAVFAEVGNINALLETI